MKLLKLLIVPFLLCLFASCSQPINTPPLPTMTEDIQAENAAYEENMHEALYSFALSNKHADAIIITDPFFEFRKDEYTYTYQNLFEKKYIAYCTYDWDIVKRNDEIYLLSDVPGGGGGGTYLINNNLLEALQNFKPTYDSSKKLYLLVYIDSIDNWGLDMNISGDENAGYCIEYSDSGGVAIKGECIAILPVEESK